MQNSIVCSICEKDELVITDPESGEIICSRCGQESMKLQKVTPAFTETCIDNNTNSG